MNVMKTYCIMAFVLIFLNISACATIPEEAVTLNQEIGKSIADAQTAYMNLLNYYNVC